MAESSIPLLSVKRLSKNFVSGGFLGKSFRAVCDVDLDVYIGETWGIVGESGSGKTTLARCSLRLIEPSDGAVCFDGQDLAALSPAALRIRRREFQMVFQDPFLSLNPVMTVGEIISEPFEIHRLAGRESRYRHVCELLQAVSLNESLASRRPSQLSGGQLQRVGIARALALKPRLLIADEPVSALDASVQLQILNLLGDLRKRQGLTLILVSHSLQAVNYLCTHISVMHQGRIVEQSEAARFFEKPRHPYSELLIESMPILDPLRQNRTFPRKKRSALPGDSLPGCSFYRLCRKRLAICEQQAPPLKECGPGIKVACFLYS